jgi:CO/xanthine dehydrogenase Mo-binding subunit
VKEFRLVGKSLPRLDGVDSVTGRATYTVDIALPGLLHARLFRSPVPHAKIRRLDVSRARALPGVGAVLTADEAPAKRFGFGVQDEELFARDRARYVGDVIAAVVAIDEATADQAVELIECDYEPLRAYGR